MSHTRHFVLKICETVWTDIWTSIWRPKYYSGCQKKNTKYQILFGIEIIQIPNTNITIRSNYFNSIRIPNHLSHPASVIGSWNDSPFTINAYHNFITVLLNNRPGCSLGCSTNTSDTHWFMKWFILCNKHIPFFYCLIIDPM